MQLKKLRQVDLVSTFTLSAETAFRYEFGNFGTAAK